MESSNLAAPSVDRILRNEQAGFQRGLDIHPKNPPPPRSRPISGTLLLCMYIYVVDFEKAFDSGHKESLDHHEKIRYTK